MKNKRIIAMYLPQFHTFPENDEWWGKGFTEWTNTRKAVPLFPGHCQPRTPLYGKYYCLLDDAAQVWQSKLANEYGVYGFCYYHYWFNGKLLMEKPMENMLKNKDVSIPFCISWANESWARTWDGQEKQILIKQTYGGVSDWENHIQYLLPFLKDERYICIDDKPVILLYSSSRIEKCDEMVAYWKKRSRELGLKGLYIIETLNTVQNKSVLPNSDADMIFEPAYTIQNDLKSHGIFAKLRRYLLSHYSVGNVLKFDINKAYSIIKKRQYEPDRKTYAGTFTDWDNTARKGKKGTVFIGSSPAKFGQSLEDLNLRTDIGDYIFVNAWNEWAEGAYLEPDEKNQHAYLRQCRKMGEK